MALLTIDHRMCRPQHAVNVCQTNHLYCSRAQWLSIFSYNFVFNINFKFVNILNIFIVRNWRAVNRQVKLNVDVIDFQNICLLLVKVTSIGHRF